MVDSAHIYVENVQGRFYVTEDCIACDTCAAIAPVNFALTADCDHAYVQVQPSSLGQVSLCREALENCPVAAIGDRDAG